MSFEFYAVSRIRIQKGCWSPVATVKRLPTRSARSGLVIIEKAYRRHVFSEERQDRYCGNATVGEPTNALSMGESICPLVHGILLQV